METSQTSLEPTAEQIRYSNFLEKGMYLGLALLLLTFAVYVTGIVNPYLPMEDLPVHWTKNVHDYLEDAHIEPGWAWLSMVGYSDFLNFTGIALLAGITAVCYAVIIPILLKKKDVLFTILVLLEIAVLVVAASGIIEIGH